MFTGEHILTIDAKGRISVPGPFREVLVGRDEGRLVITPPLSFARDADLCLVAYPVEEWKGLGAKIKDHFHIQREVQDLLRFLFSNAVECPLDRQGRILIPPLLREAAKLQKGATMIGVDNRIEIWESERWRRRKEQVAQRLEFLGDVLAGLGF